MKPNDTETTPKSPKADQNSTPSVNPTSQVPSPAEKSKGDSSPVTQQPQVEALTSKPQRPGRDLTALRTVLENLHNAPQGPCALSPAVPLNAAMLKAYVVEEPGLGDSVPVPSIPKVTKPGKFTWFRVKGDPTTWPTFRTFTPEGEMGQITYLVAPDVAAVLGSVVSQKRLVTCITLEGNVFFWPLTVSDRPNGYSDSARIIAGEAITEWRRITADLKAKEYQAWKPRVPKPDPTWPTDEELEAMLLKAVDGKIIDSVDHPEVLKLL